MKREGYRGFLSLVWMLWKLNRNARQARASSQIVITVPVRWIA